MTKAIFNLPRGRSRLEDHAEQLAGQPEDQEDRPCTPLSRLATATAKSSRDQFSRMKDEDDHRDGFRVDLKHLSRVDLEENLDNVNTQVLKVSQLIKHRSIRSPTVL